MFESEIGNLLKSEMEKSSALELTTLKEEYAITKHQDKKDGVDHDETLP